MASIAAAYFTRGEYEKTLQYMTMAERAQPHLLWLMLTLRVAALSMLERDKEALQARDDVLARHPTASISNLPKEWDVNFKTKLVEALRKAGFPE